jgi:dihydropyrimidinase
MLAELIDVPILIVHVSGGEAIEQIRWAQDRGLNVYAETCPQYLFLTAAHLGAAGYHGAKCVCSPPPRDEASQQRVWQGLANGAFHVFSSDHAPFRYDDAHGKRQGGKEVAFPTFRTASPGSRRACRCSFPKAWARAASSCTRSWRSPRPTPRACTGCTRARERSPWAATPTW